MDVDTISNCIVRCIKDTFSNSVGDIIFWDESELYKSICWQAQRLVITDETPYQDIKGGYVLCPDGVSVVNVIGYEADLKKYWCVVNGAKCLIDGSDYKKVIAAYPPMPDVPQIDLSDIRRWIENGCKESVELEVNYTNICESMKGGIYGFSPLLTNNTVKMVWGEKEWKLTDGIVQTRLEQDKAQPMAGDWADGIDNMQLPCYQLFKHMADNHNLILLETELGDIMNVVNGMKPATDWDALEGKFSMWFVEQGLANKLITVEMIVNFFKNELTK